VATLYLRPIDNYRSYARQCKFLNLHVQQQILWYINFLGHYCVTHMARWIVQFAFKAAKPNKHRERGLVPHYSFSL